VVSAISHIKIPAREKTYRYGVRGCLPAGVLKAESSRLLVHLIRAAGSFVRSRSNQTLTRWETVRKPGLD
jgi:hypothetical protein